MLLVRIYDTTLFYWTRCGHPCLWPSLLWPSLSWVVASDGNKTKILRPRPRPVKQQQEYITEKKLFCCNTHVCYQKMTWYKNIKKLMTSEAWHGFRSYRMKEHSCLLHFSIIMSGTTVLEARLKV